MNARVLAGVGLAIAALVAVAYSLAGCKAFDVPTVSIGGTVLLTGCRP